MRFAGDEGHPPLPHGGDHGPTPAPRDLREARPPSSAANFLIDDNLPLWRGRGADFEQYRVDPTQSLMPDFFVPRGNHPAAARREDRRRLAVGPHERRPWNDRRPASPSPADHPAGPGVHQGTWAGVRGGLAQRGWRATEADHPPRPVSAENPRLLLRHRRGQRPGRVAFALWFYNYSTFRGRAGESTSRICS